jgi:hypothetical protein
MCKVHRLAHGAAKTSSCCSESAKDMRRGSIETDVFSDRRSSMVIE